ncbi:uncharacterized protein BP01DRAFT_400450 [Aspergillus saccharolyticus JOP 1030-1]|uniref:Fungal N-terminal domain-containing protein n=1 Tax=Aspergillus saccharolyticus JOP 1030-1 TaxID=1450539 RepID=A0A318ZRF4_9EURO|nr:hypothetical protein BP01DRAFT_400450 [Aspergillus saccharolyticus JOP 1030-1]PYH49174.1 hypothetical protein BP01DRAFT_400450 [Aspergillus saccharolyticus JOP 1030-1]
MASVDGVDVALYNLIRIAWDLHHNCNLVRGEAPEGFKQLVDGLLSLHNTLRALKNSVESVRGDHKVELQPSLHACLETLHALHILVARYRAIGASSETEFWEKMDWPTQQGQVFHSRTPGFVPPGAPDPDISPTQSYSRERIRRSLRYEPRDRFHQPDAELMLQFDASVVKGQESRNLTTSGWLHIAVWWLLKARAVLANADEPSLATRGNVSPSTLSWSSSYQSYLDLLKASYILYDVVLRTGDSQELFLDENRKMVSDLSNGIREDFSQFRAVDVPDYAAIHSHNHDILETIQPEEITGDIDPRSGLGDVRYTTVEIEDAGNEDEHVVFRTFVNAGIGSKKLRMRTKGAPYMLLLSSKAGESEPKISLCNQMGTLFLQRDFAPADLTQLVQISDASLEGLPVAKSTEPVTLMFGGTSVSISFQYLPDLVQFISVPKAYFDAVWPREPVSSDEITETVIFKGSAEVLEQLKAPSMVAMSPAVVYRSCEVRVLERSYKEAWRSIRRIVISSSVADKNPMCIDWFMPLSWVQIHRNKGTRQALLKWSDTGQERSDKTDGNYNPLFSNVYDEKNPNIGISIEWPTEQAAEEFEQAILSLNGKPIFSWSQTQSSGHIYDNADDTPEQKKYKSIIVCQSHMGWRTCGVYYVYRDTDYIYEHANRRVRFPHIFHTHYISTHVDQLYRAETQVRYSHSEKTMRSVTICFDEELTLQGFMSSLASSHELVFSRRATSLTTKGKLFFGLKKSSKGDSEVQLWRNEEHLRLAARWKNEQVADRWLTMGLPAREPTREPTRICFPNMEFSRGMVLNMAQICAGKAKDPGKERVRGPITITFPTSKGRLEAWRYAGDLYISQRDADVFAME